MATGTSNLTSTAVTGNPLSPGMANDLATLVSRADDETLYDLIGIEPPTAASATKVNAGYIPLRDGPLVTGDALERMVWIAPSRWVRSATSVSTPRRILSATVELDTPVYLPTVAPAGKWGIELLYAQLTYVDPTEPAKGAQVAFAWAPAPTYVNTGTAATPAVLPANTSTTWNIPVAYVKNRDARTYVDQHDILSPTPSATSGYDGRLRRRVGFGAIDAQRGYSSTAQAVATLAAANAITNLLTPAKAHKADTDFVIRHFNLPASMTGDSGGAVTYTDLDDTRDWRNGTFISFWNVACLDGTVKPAYLGEEDTATGASNTRQAPRSENTATFPAQYTLWGQSFEERVAGYRWIAQAGVTGTWGNAPSQGTPFFEPNATDSLALVVDSSTGVLKLRRTITAAIAGGPVSILLIGIFPNSR